jgi:hypothetical protein
MKRMREGEENKVIKKMRGGKEESKVMRRMREKNWRSVIK